MTSTPYGNATLATHVVRVPGAFIADVMRPNGGAGILLGRNIHEPPEPRRSLFDRSPPARTDTAGFIWWLDGSRGHGLCFSATGGGKNTNLITGGLLSYGGACLCLDPKGENAWITAPRRRAMGQRVVILDPWNRVNDLYGSKVGVTEQISRFNPLAALDPRSPDFNDDVTAIADAVIYTPDRADPHWADSARELVAGMIAATAEEAPGFGSFRDVRDALVASDEALKRLVGDIVQRNPSSLAGRKLRRFVAHADSKEIASIRSTAETQTAIFDAVRLLDSMETDQDAFDLADLVRHPVTLYIVLPPDRLMTHGRWMRLVIQLALKAIGRATTPPSMPVLFLLDELGTINPGGGLRSIEQAFGLLGGMGVRIWGFFQNLGQLQRDYPQTWEVFIANSQTIQLLRVNDFTTAEYFSKFIGDTTITVANNPGARDVTYSYQRVPAMPTSEIMKNPDNEILVLTAGQHAVMQRSVPYFVDPLYVGLYRPNPLYQPPPAETWSEPRQQDAVTLNRLAEIAAARVAVWAKGDGKVIAEAAAKQATEAAAKAAAWAKTDGAAHARAAAVQASAAASKASAWLGAKWKERQAKAPHPASSEPEKEP